MTAAKPASRPNVPHFSSGPCAKRPGWSPQNLKDAALGRSHRAKVGKAKLKLAIDLTREVLEVPADYRIGIVPASDTGAVEMALWSLLGARPVTMLAWESFGEGWVSDVVKELKLKDVTRLHAGYGELPDLAQGRSGDRRRLHLERHHLGRARARTPTGSAADREGLTICDATSAAFAQPLDWPKLDVVTFSWQKVLGGEAAHGMLVLSPRAVARLESYKPAWPLPKIFRMTKGGKLNEGIFEGETINTPSMLCVEDYLDALQLGEIDRRPQGADGARRRQHQGARRLGGEDAVDRFPGQGSGDPLQYLGVPEGGRSRDHRARRRCAGGLRQEAGRRWSRRKAPATISRITAMRRPGLRIWCGATVEAARRRAADAVARLGVRRDQGRAAQGGVSSSLALRRARAPSACANPVILDATPSADCRFDRFAATPALRAQRSPKRG